MPRWGGKHSRRCRDFPHIVFNSALNNTAYLYADTFGNLFAGSLPAVFGAGNTAAGQGALQSLSSLGEDDARDYLHRRNINIQAQLNNPQDTSTKTTAPNNAGIKRLVATHYSPSLLTRIFFPASYAVIYKPADGDYPDPEPDPLCPEKDAEGNPQCLYRESCGINLNGLVMRSGMLAGKKEFKTQGGIPGSLIAEIVISLVNRCVTVTRVQVT
ncbi:MAG: hypothetical protein LBD14_04465 [Puniceicoccales bacterium]|jgi:hypothetical protein|nr:hypothetical protein [Puniceicoccales bacterium]